MRNSSENLSPEENELFVYREKKEEKVLPLSFFYSPGATMLPRNVTYCLKMVKNKNIKRLKRAWYIL